MKKQVIGIMLCVALLFSLTSCSKLENSKQISYNGKVISLEMTQQEIDSILGEGVFLESYPAGDHYGGGTWYKYQYDNLTIYYLSQKNENRLVTSVFEWESNDIKTFNNLNVGISTEKLEKKLEYFSRGGSAYTAAYSLTNNMRNNTASPERVTVYAYSFDNDEKICKIRIA